jgi:hypothetical protein
MIDPNYKLLADIGRKLLTQDNLATADPIFMVQAKGRFGQWQNVQPFFTKDAADHYIYLNGHNLRAPRIYVESAFRNAEWQALRALCIAAAKGEQL